MITEAQAYEVLALTQQASKEEAIAKYHDLKEEYKKRKDDAADLRTQLELQLKIIELDDVFLFLKSL
jgi:Tfp pilus assembly protein PilO